MFCRDPWLPGVIIIMWHFVVGRFVGLVKVFVFVVSVVVVVIVIGAGSGVVILSALISCGHGMNRCITRRQEGFHKSRYEV